MQRLARQKRVVERWRNLERRVDEMFELAGMVKVESDAALEDELRSGTAAVAELLDDLELELAFRSEYDSRNVILAIHAGAGGTESQDWAEMLLRMYLRWAERRGFDAEVLDTSAGDEAGIKNAIVAVNGDYAAGYLKSEHGVHRLVRLSPFDADHARHTSFALVEVMPEAETDADVNINPDDLKVETFRSSGPGGQHMQKTSSAVRITHLPSGIVAACQSERSQHQNKETAMKILRARLLELEIERQAQERAELKGKRVVAGWGNQIRSYVLHPYRMVKDHRTNYEVGNTDAVLDGDLDGFVTAYLRSALGWDDEK